MFVLSKYLRGTSFHNCDMLFLFWDAANIFLEMDNLGITKISRECEQLKIFTCYQISLYSGFSRFQAKPLSNSNSKAAIERYLFLPGSLGLGYIYEERSFHEVHGTANAG